MTHGYFVVEDEHELAVMKPYPPLGLLYLSAFLRQRGVAVEVFDTTFATREGLKTRLGIEPGGVIGIYSNLVTRRAVIEIVKQAKEHGWTVVLGGPESANYPAEYLKRGADVVVIGEGEETLLDLLRALKTRGPHRLQGIAGTVFRDESGGVVTNPPRPQLRDIDRLPWPDREQIEIQRYLEAWREHHGLSSLNLITARGCPYRCRWCSHAVFGFTHRRRNYLDCVDELQHIHETYGPDQVWYADDVFTIHHRWLSNYAAELERRELKIPFETISRADRMMKEDVLETLAEMGCYRIWIGSESGSQRILDAMERGVTVEQVQWASRAAQRHGIQVGMFLMWGYDGETLDDIEATIEHVKRANPDVFLTTVAYPIKNTAYFDDVADRVVLDIPWEDATDREYAIRGRHSRDFYRHADAWLRHEMAAHRVAAVDAEQAAETRHRAAEARAAMEAMCHEVEA